MKKSFKYLVLVVAMLSVLCSCGGEKLTVQTVSGVTAKLKELGLYDEAEAEVSEMMTGGQQLFGITTNYLAYSFRDFGSDEEKCDKMCTAYKDMTVDKVLSETEGSNYTIVEGEEDGGYVLIVRVDNTILDIYSSTGAKDDVKELAKALGYFN